MRTLQAVALDARGFAPFGAVIEAAGAGRPVNQGTARRFDCEARMEVDADRGRLGLGVFRAAGVEPPLTLDRLERHRLGSQGFVPMAGQRLLVVVAPGGTAPDPGALRAFVSDGRQGVVYDRGTWHHPLLVLDGGGEVLVLDRRAGSVDCEEWLPPEPVRVEWPP